jgi:3-carboxy-cis,cis-muconate cycloisomerase
MRPSSSSSDPAGEAGRGLFGGLFARGDAARAVGDEAWIAGMLAFEAALARASADAGLASAEAAERVAAAAAALRPDPDALGRAAAEGAGNPVPALVRALTAATDDGTPAGAEAAGIVHRGATSQDALDTAAMLVARDALDALLVDLAGAADACARLAREHRDLPVAGRTLLQQAVPTTFGLKAAGWLAGLDDATRALRRVRDDGLAVQLGGASGTLASLGEDGVAVAAGVAGHLGLAEPDLPWHAGRTRIAALAGALGVVGVAIAKPAGDVVLLAQTEVGEVREATGGGSSTMPHKQNPVAAVTAVACAARVPQLVAALLTAGAQEHERAAGRWHAEWETLSDLLRVAGSGAAWLRASLEGLVVDAGRAAENLGRTGGAVLAEAVVAALAGDLGRLAAHDLVTRIAADAARTGTGLREALLARPEVADRLGAEGIEAALDPAGYAGSAGAFVDRALVAHERVRP